MKLPKDLYIHFSQDKVAPYLAYLTECMKAVSLVASIACAGNTITLAITDDGYEVYGFCFDSSSAAERSAFASSLTDELQYYVVSLIWTIHTVETGKRMANMNKHSIKRLKAARRSYVRTVPALYDFLPDVFNFGSVSEADYLPISLKDSDELTSWGVQC